MEPPVFYGERKSRRLKPGRKRTRFRVNPADHLGLARMVAVKYGADKSAIEDSWQYADAVVALCRAALDFDPKRGFQFGTMAVHYMRRQVVNGFKMRATTRRAADRQAVSLASRMEGVFGTSTQIADTIPDRDHEAPWEAGERRLLVARYLGVLTPRERRVVTLYYLSGLTMLEVGAAVGVCKERVRQILERSLDVMRREASESSHRRPTRCSASTVASVG